MPSRHVERVHPAALPAAAPSASGASLPFVSLGGDLVPVIFAGALLGAADARLAPHHKMVLLSEQQRRALLWVDAVEDVVEHSPIDGPVSGREELVAGWSGGERTLAVLDVQRLLDVAIGPVQPTSGVPA